LGVREECSTENADGADVVAGDGDFAGGDVVCFADVEDMDDNGVDAGKFASIGIAIFQGAGDDTDTSKAVDFV
jgi:hypothetical protein